MSEQPVYDDQILEVYSYLWQYKDLLKGSPVLELDPGQVTPETKSTLMPQIEAKTKAVVAYLLGLRESGVSVSAMAAAIEKFYQKDDFWRRLLVKYAEAVHAREWSELQDEKKVIVEQVSSLSEKVASYRQERKEIIKAFAAAVEKEKFPVNAQKLFVNYLNMADKNPKEAWSVLTTNPAYFSPMNTTDAAGKVVLSASEAKSQNEKLAQFLKKLKA